MNIYNAVVKNGSKKQRRHGNRTDRDIEKKRLLERAKAEEDRRRSIARIMGKGWGA